MSSDGVPDNTLTADGTPKLGIAVESVSRDDFGYSILPMPNGKIVIAERTGDDLAFLRLNADGPLPAPTFYGCAKESLSDGRSGF